MIKNYSIQRVTEPTVYVTKGRQRVKQYENSIYLKNGDEFEIELFNPTTSKILAKINLNGKSLGSGVVLRPGERVFLERYFDIAKKFLFETYIVDGNDEAAKNAIRDNGIVDVEFFTQYVPATTVTWYPSQSSNYRYYGEYSPTYTSITCSLNSVSGCGESATPKSLETGRIEQGSNSDQSFVNDSTTFNSSYTWKMSWHILPESQKPIMKEDLVVYCTNCSAKRKKPTHKFCPNCGQLFE